jgi:hypothetical protein
MTLLPLFAALTLAAGPISLQYDGTLKDAIKQIAAKGNLSVVLAGDLDEPVQVNLSDVAPEEALESIAKVYGLSVSREGKLMILRRAHGHVAEVARMPPSPALPMAAMPPVPPAPPEPGEAASAAELAQEAADRVREEAEAAREKAQELREKAQEMAEARREQADALREMAQANAELEKNRVSAGGPVRVEKGTTVDNAVAYGGPVIVEADATVSGDVVAFGGDVVLEENAVVDGDAVSFGGSVVRGTNSVVRGETVSMGGAGLGTAISRSLVKPHRGSDHASAASSETSARGNRVALFLLEFAVFFGLGFLLKMFVPQRMRALEATIQSDPVKNGIAGLLGLLGALFLVTPVLLISIVGIIPAVLMWVLVVPVLMAVGGAAVASTLGSVLPTGRIRKTQALALGLGVLVLLLASQVPVLGWLVLIAAVCVSMGAIFRTRFGQPTRGTPIFEAGGSAAAVTP